MATDDKISNGIKIGTYEGSSDLSRDLGKYVKGDIVFFCIGTDRSSGDCFAPLVGTMLKDIGYKNVIGDLDRPVHAVNIHKRINEIPVGATVLAIDASLGSENHVGKIVLNRGNLRAGSALNKNLPLVGDFNVCGIVNISDPSDRLNFSIIQNTRLSTVMKMAKKLTSAIEIAYPLDGKDNLYKLAVDK